MDLFFPHHMSEADITALSLLLEQIPLCVKNLTEGTESRDVTVVKFSNKLYQLKRREESFVT
jgi:hypothetical protein